MAQANQRTPEYKEFVELSNAHGAPYVSAPDHPGLLRPAGAEVFALGDRQVEIPKLELRFRPWKGATLAHTFGSKPLIDFGGRPVFAELCVYELFRLSGWDARWVETYGAPPSNPYLLTDWQDAPLKQQQPEPIPDASVASLIHTIAQFNEGSYSGCWDVVGWFRGSVVFTELKRRKKDRIRSTQPAWLAAGLQAGLQPKNFLIIEWDFNLDAQP